MRANMVGVAVNAVIRSSSMRSTAWAASNLTIRVRVSPVNK